MHAHTLYTGPSLLVLLTHPRQSAPVHLGFDELPYDRKEGRLQCIGEQPRAEASAYQAAEAVGGDDEAGRLEVSDLRGRRLRRRLDHAYRVGRHVGDARRDAPHACRAKQAVGHLRERCRYMCERCGYIW